MATRTRSRRPKADPREVDALGPAFLGLQLYLLLASIDAQGNDLLRGHGARLHSRLASSLMLIERLGPLSVTELAGHLRMSHQLTAHRIAALRRLGLVTAEADAADQRRVLLRLTRSGRTEAARLARVCEDAAAAYRDLFAELGCDLFDALVRARTSLDRRGLAERAPRRGRS